MWDPRRAGRGPGRRGRRRGLRHLGRRPGCPFHRVPRRARTRPARRRAPSSSSPSSGMIREPSQYLFTGGRRLPRRPARPIATATGVERIGNAHVRPRRPRARHGQAPRATWPGCSRRARPSSTCTRSSAASSTAISVERLAQLLLGIAVAVAAIVFVGSGARPLRGDGRRRRPRAARPRLHPVEPHRRGRAPAPAHRRGRRSRSRSSARSPSPPGSRSATPAPSTRTWASTSTGRSSAPVPRARSRSSSSAVRSPWRGDGAAAWTSTPRAAPNVLTAAVRRRVPLPVGLGTTMAFEAGRGRRSVPVRPALLGAIAGVLGIVGTFTVEHGLDDALGEPGAGRGHVGRDRRRRASDDYTDQVDTAVARLRRAARRASATPATSAILGREVLDVDGARRRRSSTSSRCGVT